MLLAVGNGWLATELLQVLYSMVLSYGLEPKEVPNPKLTWEKSTSYNIGFDSRWFRNKFDFSFEYFYRLAYDILDNLNVSVPTTFGASLPKKTILRLNPVVLK